MNYVNYSHESKARYNTAYKRVLLYVRWKENIHDKSIGWIEVYQHFGTLTRFKKTVSPAIIRILVCIALNRFLRHPNISEIKINFAEHEKELMIFK